jgi:hypothetical protein
MNKISPWIIAAALCFAQGATVALSQKISAPVYQPGIVTPTAINVTRSPYAVQPSDSLLYVDSSGGAVVIDLQPAAARHGMLLEIKEVSGTAATAGYGISIVPNGSETVEGLNPLSISANYGGFRLYPATSKYVIAP